MHWLCRLDRELDLCGVRLSVNLYGTGFPVLLPRSYLGKSLSHCSLLLTQLTSHMFLYKSFSFSQRAPRVFHSHNVFLFSLISHTPALPSYSTSLNRVMATASRQQPMWQKPTAPPDAALPNLFIYNSLTKKKEPFVPLDWENRKVKWYACGMCIEEIPVSRRLLI